MKLVHMHQPHFLPSPQYFARMSQVDVFLFADDVQHKKGWWEHRNRILRDGRPLMLTLPLVQDDSRTRIDHKRIHAPARSFDGIAQNLRHAYHRSRGWPLLEQLCDRMIDRACAWSSLAACAMELALLVCELLALPVNSARWSEHPLAPSAAAAEDDWRSERIARYVERFGGDAFLHGRGTASYLDRARFAARGIALVADAWEPVPYPQGTPAFVPGLSVVDLIAHTGVEAPRYLGRVR